MNGASASRAGPPRRGRRIAIDLALLTAAGLLLSELGPYRTLDQPPLLRRAYWLTAVIGAGLAGILTERLLTRWIHGAWRRVLAVALVITPPVTLFVYALNAAMLDLPRRWWLLPQLAWQVLVVMLVLMAVRALVWRKAVETRTVIEPPLPDADREFRRRLSAKRRRARLIALEAEDHFVRVHTDLGAELVAVRLTDAIAELGRVHGYRLHRSWWASAEAIEQVKWRRGGGEARLAGGIVAPVSRSHAPALKAAGWR